MIGPFSLLSSFFTCSPQLVIVVVVGGCDVWCSQSCYLFVSWCFFPVSYFIVVVAHVLANRVGCTVVSIAYVLVVVLQLHANVEKSSKIAVFCLHLLKVLLMLPFGGFGFGGFMVKRGLKCPTSLQNKVDQIEFSPAPRNTTRQKKKKKKKTTTTTTTTTTKKNRYIKEMQST